MNNLYNKILRESLDLMDFDSWDDSEQSFKENIADSLNTYFIYLAGPTKNSVWEPKDCPEELEGKCSNICIFDFMTSRQRANYTWPLFDEYKNKVCINGKRISSLNDTGLTHEIYPINEKLQITIIDLDKINTGFCMFVENPNLIKVPYFDTSKFKCMDLMFFDCINLESVPLLNIKNVKTHEKKRLMDSDNGILNMFYGCDRLDKKTFEIWGVDSWGCAWGNSKRILTEALEIFDFDSWDDSEQVFKEDISKKLKSPFIYVIRPGTGKWQFHIVNSLWINAYGKDILSVFINGKTEKLYSILGKNGSLKLSGATENYFGTGEYIVQIPQITERHFKGTECESMFAACGHLKKVPWFDTKGVTNMGCMFDDCESLEEVPLFDMSKVKITSFMFRGCSLLESVPPFKLSSCIEEMLWMFSDCKKLKTVPLFNKNLKKWSESGRLNVSGMFEDCESLDNETIQIWNPDNVWNTPMF